MKILAIVVTYYPERDLLEKNISAFIDDVEKVLIWENTPSQEKEQYRFIHHSKVEYCGDGINSISHGLNLGWKYARDNGYDYLLTMDQDSQWENFNQFLNYTVYKKDAPFGIWCPHINDDIRVNTYQSIESSITSGTLIPLEIINKIGGWNEFFTIDSVDTEFFAHAINMGFKVILIGCCRLIQQYGNPQTVRFLNHSFELRNDKANRLYYIYRNYVIAMRMYPKSKILKEGFRHVWLAKVKWILVFEVNRFSKLYAILKGILDGYRYNLKDI